MEQLDSLIKTNGIPNKLNNNQPTSLRKSSTSPETYHAIWKLINKSRLLNGWMARPMDEIDDTIEAWAEIFDHYQIPVDAYPALYQRAFDARQRRMNAGQDVPTMDATVLVAQWTGDNGLQKELRDKERIAADRQLDMGGIPCPDDIKERLEKFGVKI